MASIVLASIDIDASMQDVWDYVMDPRHYRDWVTIVDAVSNVDSGPLRTGFRMDQIEQLSTDGLAELPEAEPLAPWE